MGGLLQAEGQDLLTKGGKVSNQTKLGFGEEKWEKLLKAKWRMSVELRGGSHCSGHTITAA